MSFADLLARHPADGSRHAALVVHAMQASDQEWLLERLPEPEQVRLRALLKELVSLNIPSDKALLADALTTPLADRTLMASAAAATKQQAISSQDDLISVPVMSDFDFFVRLDAGGVHILATVLQKEPALLVVRCLQMHRWAWQQELLNQLSPVQRRKVQDLLKTPACTAVPATLANAMWHQLRQRCENEKQGLARPPRALGHVAENSRLGRMAWLFGLTRHLRGVQP